MYCIYGGKIFEVKTHYVIFGHYLRICNKFGEMPNVFKLGESWFYKLEDAKAAFNKKNRYNLSADLKRFLNSKKIYEDNINNETKIWKWS